MARLRDENMRDEQGAKSGSRGRFIVPATSVTTGDAAQRVSGWTRRGTIDKIVALISSCARVTEEAP